MPINRINNRLEDLFTVLFYCTCLQDSGRGVLFKPNERICINQERGALLTQLACLNDEITALDVRTYKVPPQLELKIRFALEKLEETNF